MVDIKFKIRWVIKGSKKTQIQANRAPICAVSVWNREQNELIKGHT